MTNNLLKHQEEIINQYQKENKYLWFYAVVATLIIALLIML